MRVELPSRLFALIGVQNQIEPYLDNYGYLKDSMDRFGDDLTEEVLQYLTFDDKIRLECVSKQWQRCVYQRQYVIDIDVFNRYNNQNQLHGLFRRFYDERQSDEQRLVSVVKKCPNITKVILRRVSRSGVFAIASRLLNTYFNIQSHPEVIKKLDDFRNNVTNDLSFLKEFGEKKRILLYFAISNRFALLLSNSNTSVLSLIGRYCPNIKSLDITISGEEDREFFQHYGHKLQELRYQWDRSGMAYEDYQNYPIKNYLKLCPNLKNIHVNKTSILLDDDKEFLPKLESYQDQFGFNSSNEKQMKILSDKYSRRLKYLRIWIKEFSYKELKTCIECIARFENLKQLKLSFSNSETTEPIVKSLAMIGKNCNKLLKLDLSFESSVPKSIFYLFSHFKALKKLKITLPEYTVLSGSVECFKHCKQLNDIDINYPELREDFFTNIASFVPKLQSLRIITDQKFSDSFINSFHSLKNIEKVNLRKGNNFNLGENDKYWCFGKRWLKIKAKYNGRKGVIQVNDNCGLIPWSLAFMGVIV